MVYKKLAVLTLSFALSGAIAPALVVAEEVSRNPLNSEQAALLHELGGTQIQSLVEGDSVAIEEFSAKYNLDPTQVGEALVALSSADQQALLSVSPSILNAIVAGEMEASEILLGALAGLGLFFIILVIAAS